MDCNVSAILQAVRKLEANKGRKPKVSDPKKHNLEVEDWQELQKGDVVRSIQGHGPYFDSPNGKIFQGSYGYYKVDEMNKDGFYAYEYSPRGRKLDFGGRRFVYMGESKKVDVVNRQPHKLLKVNV